MSSAIEIIRQPRDRSDLLLSGKGFAQAFQRTAQHTVWAPYRIAPLGAHLDHQYGPVTACAINHGVQLSFSINSSDVVNVLSREFPEPVNFSLAELDSAQVPAWGRYVLGAASVLTERYGIERGVDGYVSGPIAQAGLSSSAAVGLAYLLALSHANGLTLGAKEFVALDGEIEQRFIGLKNGILDPAAIAFGQADTLTEIDTRTCDIKHHKAGAEFSFVAIHSGVSKALTPGNFNERVEQSHQAARALADMAGLQVEHPVLGDIPKQVYAEHGAKLEPTMKLRAEHFFSEKERVQLSTQYWREGNLAAFGELMSLSAFSSINNYECGATPVKDLLSVVQNCSGVYGARFCGPGFRGCVVALVDPASLDELAAVVSAEYGNQHPSLVQDAYVLECKLVNGLELLD